MFGFGKKKSTAPQQSPVGAGSTASDVAPGPVEAPLAANAVQLVSAGAGLTTVNTGTTVWLQSAAIGLEELDLAGLDVRIEVSGSEAAPLVHDAVMDWNGVLDDLDPIDIQRLVNAWNDQYVAPRVFSYQDGQNHTRVRGEMVMTWWEGHTVAQLDEYLRAVVFGAMNLSQWLEQQWPQAERRTPETVPEPGGAALGGEDRGVAASEELAAQFVVPGNPFGFVAAATAAVTPQRIESPRV